MGETDASAAAPLAASSEVPDSERSAPPSCVCVFPALDGEELHPSKGISTDASQKKRPNRDPMPPRLAYPYGDVKTIDWQPRAHVGFMRAMTCRWHSRLCNGFCGALLVWVGSDCTRGAPSFAAADAGAGVPSPSSSASAAAFADHVKVSAEVERACVDICGRSHELNCSRAGECQPHCMAMGSLTPCSATMMSFYGCLVGQPTKNWECGDDGVAAIRSGFCDSEQAKVVRCMEEKMSP
jgi:hypothetical protein